MEQNSIILFRSGDLETVIGVLSEEEAFDFLSKNDFTENQEKHNWERKEKNESKNTTARIFPIFPAIPELIPHTNSFPQAVLDLLGDLGE